MNRRRPFLCFGAISWRELGSLALIVAVVWGLSTWARQGLHEGQAQSLREKAKPGDIVMLSSRSCVYCTLARQWFEAERIPYAECFIESNAQCAQRYRETLAQGTPTFLVRGQVILGLDRARMVALLEQTKAVQP